MKTNSEKKAPQVKICGLTRPDEAVGCAAAGADAIGLVFYPKSPRHVTHDQAQTIIRLLPDSVRAVGVFVNETFSAIMQTVEYCSLAAVQLHGNEPPEMVARLAKENILVIKALFEGKNPSMSDAEQYNASAFLVECGKGMLPGGNAMVWNWEKARPFGNKYTLILAGGLDPDNVQAAIFAGLPNAVDVSSGVEISPGRKDLSKVLTFIDKVKESAIKKAQIEPIF